MNVLNWLLVAAGLFMAFIGYACIVVGARSERDDWEEREKKKSVMEQLKSQPKAEHKKIAPKKSAEREI